MIDNFTILLTTGLTLLVVLRAVLRDAAMPWFQTTKSSDQSRSAPAEAPLRGWQARQARKGRSSTPRARDI